MRNRNSLKDRYAVDKTALKEMAEKWQREFNNAVSATSGVVRFLVYRSGGAALTTTELNKILDHEADRFRMMAKMYAEQVERVAQEEVARNIRFFGEEEK